MPPEDSDRSERAARGDVARVESREGVDAADARDRSRRTGAARFAYLVVGGFFVGLGVLGAFLPVLPTTPFLLISLWAFSKSSARLETWLLEHKRFGPRLLAWRTNRVIPLPAKLAAWGSMLASLTFMAIVHRPLWQIGLAALPMAIGAAYVASKPSRPPTQPE